MASVVAASAALSPQVSLQVRINHNRIIIMEPDVSVSYSKRFRSIIYNVPQ